MPKVVLSLPFPCNCRGKHNCLSHLLEQITYTKEHTQKIIDLLCGTFCLLIKGGDVIWRPNWCPINQSTVYTFNWMTKPKTTMIHISPTFRKVGKIMRVVCKVNAPRIYVIYESLLVWFQRYKHSTLIMFCLPLILSHGLGSWLL